MNYLIDIDMTCGARSHEINIERKKIELWIYGTETRIYYVSLEVLWNVVVSCVALDATKSNVV